LPVFRVNFVPFVVNLDCACGAEARHTGSFT
jgi:hypothetical protein